MVGIPTSSQRFWTYNFSCRGVRRSSWSLGIHPDRSSLRWELGIQEPRKGELEPTRIYHGRYQQMRGSKQLDATTTHRESWV